MPWWVWFILGMFVGMALTVLMLSLAWVAGNADEIRGYK